MKNLILAVFLIFIYSDSHSGDFSDLKLRDSNNSYSLLTLRYKTLPKNTCDLCGCYIGIDGQDRNQIGIRYRIREFKGSHEYDGIAADVSPVREHFNTLELYGTYIISPKILVSFSLPYSVNSVETGNFSGFGDLLITTKYLVMGKRGLQPASQYKDRLFLGGGFKIPTGRYNISSAGADVEPHFQTGTGSFDFILLGTYIARVRRFGFNSDVVYKINTQNSNSYRFANRFNFSTTLLYIFPVNLTSAFTPNAGVYFELANPDKINNADDNGSGGKILFITGGLNFNSKYISLSLDYQKPVYQNFIGYQPVNNFRFISSVSCFF